MAKIVNVLEAHPQVQTVRTNVKTGSIVIHHDRGELENVLDSLKDLGYQTKRSRLELHQNLRKILAIQVG
jgi:hypothetical protein